MIATVNPLTAVAGYSKIINSLTYLNASSVYAINVNLSDSDAEKSNFALICNT